MEELKKDGMAIANDAKENEIGVINIDSENFDEDGPELLSTVLVAGAALVGTAVVVKIVRSEKVRALRAKAKEKIKGKFSRKETEVKNFNIDFEDEEE